MPDATPDDPIAEYRALLDRVRGKRLTYESRGQRYMSIQTFPCPNGEICYANECTQAKQCNRGDWEDAAELRAHAEQLERNAEDADKVKAFNLLLTAVNPVVRTLAERYLEGVKDMEYFTEFLRNHPFHLGGAK